MNSLRCELSALAAQPRATSRTVAAPAFDRGLARERRSHAIPSIPACKSSSMSGWQSCGLSVATRRCKTWLALGDRAAATTLQGQAYTFAGRHLENIQPCRHVRRAPAQSASSARYLRYCVHSVCYLPSRSGDTVSRFQMLLYRTYLP